MDVGDEATDEQAAVPGSSRRATEFQELIAVVLLSVTAILTAWSGFEASKWGGAMSISFSQASSARIEAAQHNNAAVTRQAIQVSLFTAWVQATGEQNQAVADFISARFPEPLATAFQDWLATKPLQNPSAPDSPFDMPSYQLDDKAQAAAADNRADMKYRQALRNNQRGDNYTVLTVLFAAVLFFGALTTRLGSYRARWILLSLAIALFLTGVGFLAALPKLV
jgi:hypothetical protein